MTTFSKQENKIINLALKILSKKARLNNELLTSPEVVGDYLALANSQHDQSRERVSIVYLDSQHRLISHKIVAEGTLMTTSVYPREIVKEALALNAAAIILSHNHPSGILTPSDSDIRLTKTIRDALALIDCRVLDHIIVNQWGGWRSLASDGLI